VRRAPNQGLAAPDCFAKWKRWAATAPVNRSGPMRPDSPIAVAPIGRWEQINEILVAAGVVVWGSIDE
jgi:hypothetical protein